MNKVLRIVYMGTPEFAVAPLRALVEGGYNVVAVVTAPDKPAGRGLKVQESAVKRYAAGAGLPVLQPVALKDEAFLDELRGYAPDLGIVVAFRMLPQAVWGMPRLGTFNLHASLLPQYRGAAPINWALINGEKKTGVTTFFLNAKMDEGAVIAQREVEIAPDDNAGTLHDKLMEAGTALVVATVDAITAGTAAPQAQCTVDPTNLKPAPKIFRDTCRIDFSRSGKEITDLVRGLSPYPAAWAELRPSGGGEPLPVKVFAAIFEPVDTGGATPGEIVSDGKSFVKAVCADGFVRLLEAQPSGKRAMSAEEFLRGFRDICNHRFV